ncbi:MAG: KpsF/GutQ family sugar-phosphate isomerase [Verrucomicrobia bacterium]|nr:KpsF/GutQ family sugar-phosphate isomerase [Verrucomicrobiota bacterium]
MEALHETLQREKKIVVIGVGKSESIGKKLVATLNSTGATAVALSCQNALHGDLGLLSNGDVIIALSYSGETTEMMTLLPHVKKRASKVIAITGNPSSTLAKHSDIVLDTSVDEEACPLRLAPTSSSTNMLALGDALAMVLLEKRGFRAEDFAELHPGGSLGKYLLTRVTEIMRHDDDLAKVTPETPVQDAILTMLKCRAGAAVVVNSQGGLAGIFTHGDFVRGYQNDHQIGDTPVKNHMTSTPITIHENDLAVEVVKILRESRIDDLIVVNDRGEPVGLVDVQDLSRFGVS